MIVGPDFLDHWRTRMLVDALGGDEMAPIYVLRMWSHCQQQHTATFAMPSHGLKALCRAPGDAANFEAAMTTSGFIVRTGDALSAPMWVEKNAALIAAWGNGTKGGRPKKASSAAQIEPKQEPMGNPWVTHGLPMGSFERVQTPMAGSAAAAAVKPGKSKAPSPDPWLTVTDLAADGLDADLATSWLAHRSTKKAKLTARAWGGFKVEAQKAGWSYPDAVAKAIARNWTSFDAEWVPGPAGVTTRGANKTSFTLDREAAAASWIGSANLPGMPRAFMDVEARDVTAIENH